MQLKPLTKLPTDLKPGDVLVVLKRGSETKTENVIISEVDGSAISTPYGGKVNSVGLYMGYRWSGRELCGDTGPVVRVIRKASAKAKPKRDRDADWLCMFVANYVPMMKVSAKRRILRIAKRLDAAK